MSDPVLRERVKEWLAASQLASPQERADIAIDFEDLFTAASSAQGLLKALLSIEWSDVDQRESVRAAATEIHVQLFTELDMHLASLRGAWDTILQRMELHE